MKKVAGLLENFLNKILIKNDSLVVLLKNWKIIVDDNYSSIVYPYKIHVISENNCKINILYLKLSNNCMSLTLLFQQDLILQKINKYFGYEAINRIRFIKI